LRHKNIIIALALGMTALVVFLPGTASMSLWDRDEACNAQCAREMLQRKDPIVPTFNFSLRTDKPPLEYWAVMASYSLLGVNEFAARLPSVLFSVGTILLVFIFGSRLWGTEVGLLASLIMLSSIHFPIVARAATPDPAFIFFLTLSLLLFLTEKPTLGYGAAGLAVLAKGPLGIVIPLGTELLYLLFSEGKGKVKKAFPLKGVSLFLAIALPWYVVVDVKTHNEFFKGFILYHNVTRFLRPIGGHRGPAFYYVLVLLVALLPWSPLLLQTLYHLFRRAKECKGNHLFIYLWILFSFALFSLAKTKLPNYIMPVYPALALAMALEAKERVEKGLNRDLRPAMRGTLVSLGIIAILLGFMGLQGTFASPGLSLMAGVILLLGIWGFQKTEKAPLRWFTTLAFLMAVLLTAIPHFTVPRLEQRKLSPSFARKIRSEIGKGDLIVTYPFSIPSLVFYTNHRVIRERKRSSLKKFLASHGSSRIFIVTRPKKLRAVYRVWKGKVRVLERGHSLYPHGKLALALLSPIHRQAPGRPGGDHAKQRH